MEGMTRIRAFLSLVLITGCGGARTAAAASPAPAAAAASAPSPPIAATPAPPPPPAPAPVAAKPDEPPPAPGACNGRKISFAVTRAVGMGSYITTLHCSNSLFTVISDRATPDGREVKSAFQVDAAEWEKVWSGIEKLAWRTFDDKCTPREAAQGRGDGPVYRLTIEDPTNKRTFICVGARELAEKVDALQTELLSILPPELSNVPVAGVGVPECDDYLDKYQRCVEQKVPADKRSGFLEAIRLTRSALRDTLLREPDADLALAKQCKEMHSAARTAMAQFKCKL
jgi:hypothetical protein